MSDPQDIVTPVTAALVRGALELEPTEDGVRPHRLPTWARTREADAQLSMVEAQPAGVRLVFATASSWLGADGPGQPVRVRRACRPDRTASSTSWSTAHSSRSGA